MPDLENAVSVSTNNGQQPFQPVHQTLKKSNNQSQESFNQNKSNVASNQSTTNNSNKNCSFIRIYIGNSTTVVIYQELVIK
jgi:hypothetical protein